VLVADGGKACRGGWLILWRARHSHGWNGGGGWSLEEQWVSNGQRQAMLWISDADGLRLVGYVLHLHIGRLPVAAATRRTTDPI
jgi:hypothetical protein